jgi:predicted flap endonuclease-1-like 5' DNA nuclease
MRDGMLESMKIVPILKVEGIGKVYAEKLYNLGIKSTRDLLIKGRTSNGREDLAQKSGISPKLILEWVQDSDLMRIKGVSEEYSDLLDEAGVKDVTDLAKRDPADLLAKMLEAAEKKNIVRKPPSLKQVINWIEQAKKLPKIIEY